MLLPQPPACTIDPYRIPPLLTDTVLSTHLRPHCPQYVRHGEPSSSPPRWSVQLEYLYRAIHMGVWTILFEEQIRDSEFAIALGVSLGIFPEREAPPYTARPPSREWYQRASAVREMVVNRMRERYERVYALLYVRNLWLKGASIDYEEIVALPASELIRRFWPETRTPFFEVFSPESLWPLPSTPPEDHLKLVLFEDAPVYQAFLGPDL